MVLISFVALSILQSVESVPVTNVTAAKIVQLIAKAPPEEGLVPKELKVSIDTATNSILLSGKKSDIDNAKKLIQVLDVRPRQIRVRLYVASGRLGRDWIMDTTVYNNEPVVLSDEGAGMELSLFPRILNNGAIKFALKFSDGEPPTSVASNIISGDVWKWGGKVDWTSTEMAKLERAFEVPGDKLKPQAMTSPDGKVKIAFRLDIVKL